MITVLKFGCFYKRIEVIKRNKQFITSGVLKRDTWIKEVAVRKYVYKTTNPYYTQNFFPEQDQNVMFETKA